MASTTPKRKFSEAAYVPSKKVKTGVICRILLNKSQVGAVIGQGGATVKVLREETKAFISVLWGKTAERVCEVNAPDAAPVCAAVGRIVELMASLESDASSLELRMLAQSANVGCLIGAKGAVVSEAVREHKVRSIKVSKECIGASTEKVVTITGPTEGVASAAAWVITRLEEFPVREGVATREHKPCASIYQAQQQSFASPTAPTASALPAPPVGYAYVKVPAPQNPYAHLQPAYTTPSSFASMTATPLPSASESSITMSLDVPSSCVPGLIGKGGSVINAIKSRSGAFVSIKNSDTALHEVNGTRQVVVTGSQSACQVAISAIQDRLAVLQSQ